MKNRPNILLSINKEEEILRLSESLKNKGNCNIYIAENNLEALMIIKDKDINYVIASFISEGISGLELIKACREIGEKPHFIIHTGFRADSFEELAIKSGADYCMDEGYDSNIFASSIFGDVSSVKVKSEKEANFEQELPQDIVSKSMNILMESGFSNNWKGTKYIETSMKLMGNFKGRNISFTSYLYPEIARMHSTSSACVEKAVRIAIEKAYDKREANKFRENFLINDTLIHKKPSNSKFLSLLYNLSL